ncbi:hypothetical protein [Geminocystis sp. GBBB08]|uniref:hypothetical protein n=1 Tax=Geminocystis sp. GBBB08 TaxID=2604140 RepID=UPI0027E26C5E|nr:hypothetical protein [Geminocystis sp. GBBB08]MBL1210833.1 hypothetical protein [Geminocystis sp. GBBB08]
MIPSRSLTVESFLREANWQGFKLVTENENWLKVIENTTLNLNFSLTVEKFFALHNWQGIVKINPADRVKKEELSQNQQPAYTFTMSVDKFFQGIAWQGQNQGITKKVNIASMPTMSNVIYLNPKPLNINDLSDLL